MSDQGQATSEFAQLPKWEQLEKARRRILFEGATEQEHFLLSRVDELTEALEDCFSQSEHWYVWKYGDWIRDVLDCGKTRAARPSSPKEGNDNE
jgi:hypothetical protein